MAMNETKERQVAVMMTAEDLQTVMSMLDDDQCPESLWTKLTEAQKEVSGGGEVE